VSFIYFPSIFELDVPVSCCTFDLPPSSPLLEKMGEMSIFSKMGLLNAALSLAENSL